MTVCDLHNVPFKSAIRIVRSKYKGKQYVNKWKHVWCTKCNTLRQQAYRKNNPEIWLKAGRRKIAKCRGIIDLAKNKPCLDCGIKYRPWQMDFDHVTGVKLYNIAKQSMSISYAKLYTEISKCEVVCSNCHRQRTHDRKKKEAENGTI